MTKKLVLPDLLGCVADLLEVLGDLVGGLLGRLLPEIVESSSAAATSAGRVDFSPGRQRVSQLRHFSLLRVDGVPCRFPGSPSSSVQAASSWGVFRAQRTSQTAPTELTSTEGPGFARSWGYARIPAIPPISSGAKRSTRNSTVIDSSTQRSARRSQGRRFATGNRSAGRRGPAAPPVSSAARSSWEDPQGLSCQADQSRVRRRISVAVRTASVSGSRSPHLSSEREPDNDLELPATPVDHQGLPRRSGHGGQPFGDRHLLQGFAASSCSRSAIRVERDLGSSTCPLRGPPRLGSPPGTASTACSSPQSGTRRPDR